MPAALASAMFEMHLTPLKGHVTDLDALTFTGKISSNVTIDIMPGRLVSLNSAGQYEGGLTDRWAMPMFSLGNGTYGYDVSIANKTASNVTLGIPVIPANDKSNFGTLVGGATVEIATAAYDKSQTYVAGDFLGPISSANTRNTLAAELGVLTNKRAGASGTTIVPYTDPIVGQVSRGVLPGNQTSPNTQLAFWTLHLPAITRAW